MKRGVTTVILAVVVGAGFGVGGQVAPVIVAKMDRTLGFTELSVQDPVAVGGGVGVGQVVVVTITNHERNTRTYDWRLAGGKVAYEGSVRLKPGEEGIIPIPGPVVGEDSRWVTFEVDGLTQILRWKSGAGR